MQALNWLSSLAQIHQQADQDHQRPQGSRCRTSGGMDEGRPDTRGEFESTEIPAFMPKIEWKLSDGTVCSYWETARTREVKSVEFGRFLQAVGQGDEPDVPAMERAFASRRTHSLDALLQTALKDWDTSKLGPVTTIHDCIKLPSALPELRNRLQKAMKEVIDNPITDWRIRWASAWMIFRSWKLVMQS